MISVGGGFGPIWADDGRELFYQRQPLRAAPDAMMRVPIDLDDNAGSSPSIGPPERLFEWRYFGQGDGGRYLGLAPDGQRFLVITRADRANVSTERTEINVVLNWFEELTARVPTP